MQATQFNIRQITETRALPNGQTAQEPAGALESAKGSSVFDQSLSLFQAAGVLDEKGLVKKHPDTLPFLQKGQEFHAFFSQTHPIKTKDGAHDFLVQIPQLAQAALIPFGILSFHICLAGEGVFAFFDPAYAKAILDLLNPGLHDSLPKECLEIFTKQATLNFRVHLPGHWSKEQFQQLKKNHIIMLVNVLNHPYKYVKNNCFHNLLIVHDENNRFLLCSFTDKRHVYNLTFVDKLLVDHPFLHDSLKLYWGGAAPTGDIYQAMSDKINRIIHSGGAIDFRTWGSLLFLQTTFYRSYEKDLEKNALKVALEYMKKERSPLKACCALLESSHFCLTLSACRSLHLNGEHALASELFETLQGAPPLFEKGDSVELHLSLLQLFGTLALDGKTVCRTTDNFEPALQFVFNGYTLLIPLQLELALSTLLEKGIGPIIERYFAHFKEFSEVPDNLNLSQGLKHKDPLVRCLIRTLALWSKKSLDPEFLDLANPCAQELAIHEKYLQKFTSFTFSGREYGHALLMANHPLLSLKGLAILQGQELSAEFILKVPNPADRVKLFKLQENKEELFPALLASLTPFFKKNEGVPLLVEFIEAASALSPSASLLELSLQQLGLGPQTYALLEKAGTKSISGAYLAAAEQLQNPDEALKAWEVGVKHELIDKKSQAVFLAHLIIRFMELNQGAKVNALIPLLNREHLDKKLGAQVNGVVKKLTQDPVLGTPLLLQQTDTHIEKEEWAKAAALLQTLIDREADVKTRLAKLPNLPQNLCLHPKIGLYLSPEELISPLAAHNLFENALRLFPTQSRAENRKLIALIISSTYRGDCQKITSYVLGSQEMIDEWFTARPPEQISTENLHKYLKLRLPGASSYLRSHTTKKHLETLSEEYKAYIPLTQEMSEWITLILEAKLPHLFPVIEWMEKSPPTIEQLTLCPPLNLDVRRFVAALPITDLELLLPLYTHYKLFTPAVIASMVAEAVKVPADHIKRAVFGLFCTVSGQVEVETWAHAIQLLVQVKSELIFTYFDEKLPDPSLAAWIANGAAKLIKDPVKEVKRVEQLHQFTEKYDLYHDYALYAASKHPPLALCAVQSIPPDKIIENLPLLESAINPHISSELGKLFPLIPLKELSNGQIHSLLSALLPFAEFHLYALELIFTLVQHQSKTGSQTIATGLERTIRSSDPAVQDRACLCILHPYLPKLLKESKINELMAEVIELRLIRCKTAQDYPLIENAIEMFLEKYTPLTQFPAKEKSCLFHSIDAVLAMADAEQKCVVLFKIISKIVWSKQGPSRQLISYYKQLKMAESHINPNSYPSRPNDLLFEFSTKLFEKILKCEAVFLDANHPLVDFVGAHLYYLLNAYKENAKLLVPFIFKFAFTQLPSGYDVSLHALQRKLTVLEALLEADPPTKVISNEILEMSFLVSDHLALIGLSTEQIAKGFKKVAYRLLTHPSPNGVVMACNLLAINIQITLLLDEPSTQFLLKSLTAEIIKNPLYEADSLVLVEHFMNTLFSISKNNEKLAAHHFWDCCTQICDLVQKNREENLLQKMQEILEKCINSKKFPYEAPIFLEILNLYK